MKSVLAKETVKGESNKCICERDYITPCTYVGTRLDGFFFCAISQHVAQYLN